MSLRFLLLAGLASVTSAKKVWMYQIDDGQVRSVSFSLSALLLVALPVFALTVRVWLLVLNAFSAARSTYRP